MGVKASKKAEAVRQLVDATKTLAAIAGLKPVAKSVDNAFEELTDALRRVRHLESRGICSDNSVVSCKLPNGINVSLMAKPPKADGESTISLWPEYEQQKQRAKDRPQQADDPLRGTGRTTTGMLRAIAAALESPDSWVPFIDHSGTSSVHLDAMSRMGLALRLVLEVEVVEGTLMVRSPLSKLRASKNP